MTQSLAEIRALIAPRERSVTLVLDGSLYTDLEEARADLTRARAASALTESLGGDPRVYELTEEVARLEAQVADEATATFRLRGLGRNAYRRLVAEHPADETQWNVDTFPPALIAACSVEPAMTATEMGDLADLLTEGQIDQLFAVAYGLCHEVPGVPFNVTGSPTRS